MSEFQSYQQPSGDLLQIYQPPVERVANAEVKTELYTHVEHVDESFPLKQDNLELRHLLELDADNTIVVVGDSTIYHGGPLTYVEIPGLKADASHKAFGHLDLISVKAILEGKRVLAYATDHEKAMLYINQFKQGEAA